MADNHENDEIVEIAKNTRFRGYQIGSAGSSYSYFCGEKFTLVEGRLTDSNRETLSQEMRSVGKIRIDVLHITSWDQDHCSLGQIEEICDQYEPRKIEYPGYLPHTDNGVDCLKYIKSYANRSTRSAVKIDPKYISDLNDAKHLTYRNIFYHPKYIGEKSNDNSTIKFFRSGSFSVLSLGDVENHNISSFLRNQKIIKDETDILILPHHGADNGFLTMKFLKMVKPRIAICCADYNNKFQHPKQAIRDMLHKANIPLYTTKTGDVLVESTGKKSREFTVTNLRAHSNEVSSTKRFYTKRGRLFGMNWDALRNLRRGNKRY